MNQTVTSDLRALAMQTRENLVLLSNDWAKKGLDAADTALVACARSLNQTAKSVDDLRGSLPKLAKVEPTPAVEEPETVDEAAQS